MYGDVHTGPACIGRECDQGELSMENLRIKHQGVQIHTISREEVGLDEERKPKTSGEDYTHILLMCRALF